MTRNTIGSPQYEFISDDTGCNRSFFPILLHMQLFSFLSFEMLTFLLKRNAICLEVFCIFLLDMEQMLEKPISS